MHPPPKVSPFICILFLSVLCRRSSSAAESVKLAFQIQHLKGQSCGDFRARHTSMRLAVHPFSSSDSRMLDYIEDVYVISDLHTDNIENLEWLRDRCNGNKRDQSMTPSQNDALIIAGDISHELSKLEETFSIILKSLSCHVFFVCGNHEAWVGGDEMDSLGIVDSVKKIETVNYLCKRMGVYTDLRLLGRCQDYPVVILPLMSWYDGSLALQNCEDLCASFDSWPWVDFIRCKWPNEQILENWCKDYKPSVEMRVKNIRNAGRIPPGLAGWFALQNIESIEKVQDLYFECQKQMDMLEDETSIPASKFPGLITFTHFLPNQKTLPDWKDPTIDTFLRDEWLDHPVPDISAKFAKVGGSALIDEQIRAILPTRTRKYMNLKHLHIFGHSHRPKDFVYKGIRYIHNPLGKPAEREMDMVSKKVDFQLVWSCAKAKHSDLLRSKEDYVGQNMSYSGGKGEIPGSRIIRFWEEEGGGRKALARKMKHRRIRQRLMVKRKLRQSKKDSNSN